MRRWKRGKSARTAYAIVAADAQVLEGKSLRGEPTSQGIALGFDRALNLGTLHL